MVVLTLILGAVAFLLVKFGEPVAYRYFPPSPTITRTPTITTTPTITLNLRKYLYPYDDTYAAIYLYSFHSGYCSDSHSNPGWSGYQRNIQSD